MKASKRILICVILLLASFKNYASKITLKVVPFKHCILYFENDSMVLIDQYFDFSPDSQACVVLDKDSDEFRIYDFQMKEMGKIKYNYNSAGIVKISNDHRYITYGNHIWGESLQGMECILKMYSKENKLIKDTVLNLGFAAEFINNNDLVTLNALNRFGMRLSKEEKDTRLLIFNSEYNLIIDKVINYYSDIFIRPSYDFEKNEYVLFTIVKEDDHTVSSKISVEK